MNDIAITGMGIISPLGTGRESFWESCRNAKSGLKRITTFDTHSFPCNIAGLVEDFQPGQYMKPNVYRRLSRISRMAVAAGIEAIQDSGLILDGIDRERVAVIMGTAYGASSRVEDFYISLLRDGPRGAQPLLFPETVPNAPASHIAIFHRILGPNTTFCQNELSAENAILYAKTLLLNDIVDVALVGGAEEISEMLHSCYSDVGSLNTLQSGEGQPILPKRGGGLVLGEGAGILVMERKSFAIERGAKIYGLLRSGIISGGSASIGHYEIDGEQMRRAMVTVLDRSGIGPTEIDQIDLSANLSGELDRMEHHQVKKVFTQKQNKIRVTPLKYLMGDFGGAGIIRAAAILLSLYRQEPLPVVNLDTLVGEGDTALEWHIPPAQDIRSTLMTTSTFGGGSASMIFSKA
ncbi:MAG: hypothetical protein JW932_04105 [Deltaproteobacteria bacterium]|nr:hypothetical protein [Deltaproteobacteria bacterium]